MGVKIYRSFIQNITEVDFVTEVVLRLYKEGM